MTSRAALLSWRHKQLAAGGLGVNETSWGAPHIIDPSSERALDNTPTGAGSRRTQRARKEGPEQRKRDGDNVKIRDPAHYDKGLGDAVALGEEGKCFACKKWCATTTIHGNSNHSLYHGLKTGNEETPMGFLRGESQPFGDSAQKLAGGHQNW